MDGSIPLSPPQSKALLDLYRNGKDRSASRRAHIVLLLNRGRTFREVLEITFASADLVAAAARRFRKGGVQALLREEPTQDLPEWLHRVTTWLTEKTPQDFGYFVSVCSREVPPRSPTRCSGRSRFKPSQLKETSRERTLTQVVEAIWAD
jgi:hypothetical protein